MGARGRSGRFEYGVLIGAGLLLYVVWVGGTALGTVIGDLLDPEAIGVDAAFPALFLALLAPYLRSRRALLTALVAGAITLVLIPLAARRADRRRQPRRADRAAAVSWLVIAVVGGVTIAFKAAGPVLLGKRELPPRVASVVDVLAPAMLAALVVTQTVGGDREIVIDARLAGVVGRRGRRLAAGAAARRDGRRSAVTAALIRLLLAAVASTCRPAGRGDGRAGVAGRERRGSRCSAAGSRTTTSR